MYEILLVIYLVIAVLLIGLVLVQQGKGADMGSSFGAGASATIFGSGGHGNFLTKSTTTLALVFFAISLVLGHMNAQTSKKPGEFDKVDVKTIQTTAPVKTNSSDVPTASDTPTTAPATTASDVPSSTNTTVSAASVATEKKEATKIDQAAVTSGAVPAQK